MLFFKTGNRNLTIIFILFTSGGNNVTGNLTSDIDQTCSGRLILEGALCTDDDTKRQNGLTPGASFVVQMFWGKCEAYFHLVLLFLCEPVGRRALPEAAAVVWEAASTVPDPSTQQHRNTEQAS